MSAGSSLLAYRDTVGQTLGCPVGAVGVASSLVVTIVGCNVLVAVILCSIFVSSQRIALVLDVIAFGV